MITPPATLGVLGGGQLGRYFVMAARTMGYAPSCSNPIPTRPRARLPTSTSSPRSTISRHCTIWRSTCAVVTTEFENPPATALEWLANHTAVRPSPAAVAITQDRRVEKAFLSKADVPIAPFIVIATATTIVDAAASFSYPAILKTARLGYDGKGQIADCHTRLADAGLERVGPASPASWSSD